MSHTPPIRFGVIGAGWFASRRHCLDVIDHDDAALVALCRRDRVELDKMAVAFDVEQTYTDFDDLISSGTVDAVIVCSPHHLHYEHAAAALEADLHVLLEKPITIDPMHGRHLDARPTSGGNDVEEESRVVGRTESTLLEPLPLPARSDRRRGPGAD